LAACWVIMFLNLGIPVYGASGLNALMAPSMHMDRGALGLLFSAYMVMSGLPGPLVAISVNKMGVRRTLMLGSLLLIAGALLMGTVVNSFGFALIAFGLLVGGGVATGAALAAQAGLARWFVRKRGMVLSILYSSGAVGGFVSGRLLDRVVTLAGGNWRAGWWVIAALSGVACVVAAVFVKESPAELGQRPTLVARCFGPGRIGPIGRRSPHPPTGSWYSRCSGSVAATRSTWRTVSCICAIWGIRHRRRGRRSRCWPCRGWRQSS